MCGGCPILVTSTVKRLNVQALSKIPIHHKIIVDMNCKSMLITKTKFFNSLKFTLLILRMTVITNLCLVCLLLELALGM